MTHHHDDELDRLLRDEEPAERAALAAVLRGVRDGLDEPPSPEVAERHLAAITAAAREAAHHAPAPATAASPSWGIRVRRVAGLTAVKVAIGVGVAAAATGTGMATTGNLPDPVQRVVADVAERIGIHLPVPDPLPAPSATGDDAPDTPTDGAGDPGASRADDPARDDRTPRPGAPGTPEERPSPERPDRSPPSEVPGRATPPPAQGGRAPAEGERGAGEPARRGDGDDLPPTPAERNGSERSQGRVPSGEPAADTPAADTPADERAGGQEQRSEGSPEDPPRTGVPGGLPIGRDVPSLPAATSSGRGDR